MRYKPGNILLIVEVDYNDADYNTEVSEVTKNMVETLRPWFKKISERKGSFDANESGANHPTVLYDMPEDIFEFILDLCPFIEEGFHSINSVYAITLSESESLMW